MYYLMTLGEGPTGWFFPLSMLAYGPLVYVINRLFLQRDRSVTALTLLNGTLAVSMVAGYLLLEQWRGFAYLAFAAAFLAWLTVRGFQFALSAPPLRSTLLTLDCSVLLMITFTGYSSMMGWAAHWSIPALCGLSASIIAASTSRSPRALGGKGRLAMGAAFVLLVLLMWLFVDVVATPAGSGLVALWSLIIAGLQAVKRFLFGAISYLLSLLPESEPVEMEWESPPGFTMSDEMLVPETPPVVGVILLIVAAVGAVVLLVWLIRRLGKVRLQRTQTKMTVSQPRRERTSMWKGLLQLLASWGQKLRLRYRLWKGRNTAMGLYFLLVHRCRRTPWHKRTGETAREFLMRMAAAAQSDERLHNALEELARKTDAAFYSGHDDSARLECASMIRHRIGAAVRKQFVKDTLARLKPKK